MDVSGSGIRHLSRRKGIVAASGSILGSPCILRFMNLRSGCGCSRASLRGELLSGLRRFLLRLKGKFAFITERGEFSFRRSRFEISLIFCGELLGYFMLFSLGVNGLGRRSLKRVRVCIGCCSECRGARRRGPAVNMLLYGRGGSTVIRLALPRSSGVCTSRCGLCLPSGGLLRSGLGR